MTTRLRRLWKAQRMLAVAGVMAFSIIGAMGAGASGGLERTALAGASARSVALAAPVTDVGWAVCAAGGGFVRAKGVLSCNRVGFNLYRVSFPVPVFNCSYLATIGLPGLGFPPPGEISVSSDPNPLMVDVASYNGAGAAAPNYFHIEVNC